MGCARELMDSRLGLYFLASGLVLDASSALSGTGSVYGEEARMTA